MESTAWAWALSGGACGVIFLQGTFDSLCAVAVRWLLQGTARSVRSAGLCSQCRVSARQPGPTSASAENDPSMEETMRRKVILEWKTSKYNSGGISSRLVRKEE